MKIVDILTEEQESEAIRKYQFDNKIIGAKINDVLRTSRRLSTEEARFVADLDSAIKDNGTSITKPVYRGIDGNTEFGRSLVKNLKAGYKISNPGYLSTTPYESAASGIALSSEVPIYFKIKPNGQLGVNLPESGEILFGRNSILTIISWKHEDIDNEDTDQFGKGYIISCKLSYR